AGPEILLRSLPEFGIGILAYRVYASRWANTVWRADPFFAGVCLAIVALASILSTDLEIVLLLPFLLIATATNQGFAQSLLARRPFKFLGDISYSLYMCHFVCLQVVVGLLGGPDTDRTIAGRVFVFTLCVALSFGLATLVSRCVEWPARSALRRIVL